MYTHQDMSVNIQPHCVVGIGASAGGLEALQQFLTFLPSNTGMAFVIIQHLAPNHKSMLVDILGKYNSMPITEIEDGMSVERNHIYMIPPKYNIEIQNGILKLKEQNSQEINHPIDIFFRSLAYAYENRAVAVILSGTGSDGTNGIRAIKEQNGMIIVQSPESAKFDGMPRNAITTGFVDLMLKPDSIARELAHISKSMIDAEAQIGTTDDDLLSKIFAILKNVTNINYAYYKQTTILRRIERRLVVTHNRNLQEYVNYMTNNPEEAKLLAKEVLIGVTAFFRDSDYFEVLKETVIKKLITDSHLDDELRVWVAGCSTGEEAYSIAILFAEAMEELSIRRDIKIFATDLDPDSIGTAVRGVYGNNIIEDVSVARLSKYFTRKGNKYVIHHDIRKMIIFAQHNVFQDPPFGKLDLICCRNVLIYFQTVLQRNLFAIFHMALSDRGYLFLGRSESVIDYSDVFRVVCADEKIFIHYAEGNAPSHEQLAYSMSNIETPIDPIAVSGYDDDEPVYYKAHEIDTSVLEKLMPATVLINDKNELVRSYGDCSKLISLPVGQVTLDIFQLIRNDLKIALSTALKEARLEKGQKAYTDIPIEIEGKGEFVSIVAQPINDNHGQETDFTAISFLRGRQNMSIDMQEYQVDIAATQRISDLEHELKMTKNSLRQTVTELESTNAELQAANEELLTANEELQSSNEELQSVNEELYTVNSEYQSKVTELAVANNDMANFLSSTLVGILMVDNDLNIRKYTEYISSEFSVADQDVGRSLRYISYNFATIDLIALCRTVLNTMNPVEKRCASVAGKTYLIRIAPYHEIGVIDDPEDGSRKKKRELKGLVLTFVDTTKQIDDQEQIDEMGKALRAAVKSSREKESFLSQMSHDMRTPLTAIFGLTQLSLQENDVSDTIKDNLDKILTSSKYLLSLIEEILETSRINAGKIVSISTAIKEEAILTSISTIAREQARGAGLHFNCKVSGSKDRYVLMDTKHVERSLLNLLSNSIKFTPSGGDIFFTTNITYTDEEAIHTYIIRDTGIGISEAFQKKMFLPFEQYREADDIYREGSGLGLFICKSLIELMGGTISCTSAPGKGTEFVVVLSYPIATDEQISLHTQRSEKYEDQLLFGKTVLLAEDNTINAEVIIKLLKTKGIHAEVARDGQEAVDMFKTRPPYHYQAILMDLMMPVKSGLEASKDIRALRNPDAATIPIIALTADIANDVEHRAEAAGMDRVLEKPIDQSKLFSYLATLIQKQLDEPIL
ncbi:MULTISPECIES: chemotaxis protein CheB [unclassified Butyrivibrio]|uniref:chemotaxis protein CheB n=1 Tax=unclassified Butyrivibrio TaxID=2639466 RepID=UPI0004203DCB|nr:MULTISPECIES: chemotaxis protein CheB [unclassified Butyrivibrio]